MACENPLGPSGYSAPDVRDWVTADIAAGLDSDGHFLLPPPRPPGDVPIITGTDARRFALAYANLAVGTSLADQIQSFHGAPIDWTNLEAAPRVFFAESPYADVPDTVPSYVRNSLGPYFLVHVRSRGKVIASEGVAGYATYLSVKSDGKIGFPASHGSEFRTQGVHDRSPYQFPMAPEEAVVLVGRATGVRISSIPELRRPNRLYSPGLSYWRLETEGEVRCVGMSSGELYVTDEIYVASLGEFLVGLPESSSTDSMSYPLRLGDGTLQWHTIRLDVRGGFSTQFEEVLLDARGQ